MTVVRRDPPTVNARRHTATGGRLRSARVTVREIRALPHNMAREVGRSVVSSSERSTQQLKLELELPALEVAPTALWQAIVISSFQFVSAFLSCCCCSRFIGFTLSLSAEKKHFFMTLNFHRRPRRCRIKLNHEAKYLGQGHLVLQLSCEHTHSRPTAVARATEWSAATILNATRD